VRILGVRFGETAGHRRLDLLRTHTLYQTEEATCSSILQRFC
jgi:hypothetical protein